ncbi:PQQ-binding-like beta-propeller repeat protein [Rhodanobacter sp. MP1X3]|uniref:outer membrane protein assembly factor BamB family protein n=1 Tax=Rhodanobacter sp. MP1X3 TaxID=2723086 RepID=UPI00160D71AC|nr:PQQ-binding-like beta-propeller repeat protein [Rhodanobacter sp. MP1X3]MBB6242447.1 outer membrane protein assembly factor BamB [Rhodanobacter sp. MP1X3]
MKNQLVMLLLSLGVTLPAAARNVPAQDWPTFGGNVQSTSANPEPTGITAANLGHLVRQQIKIDGTVDASAIYLHGVSIHGAAHDAIFVTTTYGKTLAIDAANGAVLWNYTPASYQQVAGTRQITNSTPVADPDRQFIYAASPDGYVQKLTISDGHPVWRTAITLLAKREKMDSPLKFSQGHVVAVTAGYIGDKPPYQGHVAVLDGASGKLLHVWNSLCSDRSGLLQPASCPQSDSAIWGRAGAVIDPASGNILVSTGNAPWDGKTAWGDSVIELNPDATAMLGNYTPANTAALNTDDADLGSSSPVLLGGDLIAQGGKDGKIRLLSRKAMAGVAPHMDHELQIVSTPSGTDLFSQPATWDHQDQTWIFAADNGGTAAWTLEHGKLQQQWKNSTGGTSPFEAGGLLFVYAPAGGLNIYDAASGKHLTTLPCGAGHWNSPIVLQGHIILPEGNANAHAANGVLNIWSLPAGNG